MNFKQFVYRNTMRNKPLYLAYFLSTLVSVMVFFTFSAMAFHPILKTGVSQNLIIGMLGSAIIIYLFSIFFVWYSMGVFLQSRKKEFGLFLIQGMSMKQLKRMISFETLIIGFWATVGGTVIGIGFSQIILWIARSSLHIDFASYFPGQAMGLTFVSFLLLFLMISFFVRFQLPKQTIQELLNADEQGKGAIHFSRVKSSLAFLLLVIGYGLALWAKGLMVITVFFPVLAMVIIGTLLFYSQLSVRLIQSMKRKKRFFWTKKNFVVFSDLAFRMKDNAKSFFLITIVSTVAFVAVGTLYGVQEIFLGVFHHIPSDFSAPADEKFTQPIEKVLKENHLDVEKLTYTTKSMAKQTFIHEKEYNQLAKLFDEQTIHLKKNQFVQLQYSGMGQPTSSAEKVTLNGSELKVQEERKTGILPIQQPTFVIPDAIELIGEEVRTSSEAVYITPNATREQKIAVGKKLSAIPLVVSKEYMTDITTREYAPVLFVGIFISLVFMVSAGSFLYFRLYSDLGNDAKKYAMIYRVGLSKNELKRMVYRQVGILFFVPLILSLAHSLVALSAMYRIFNLTMQFAAFQVLGIFIFVQVAYYLLASRLYFRSICHKIGMR